MSVGSLQLVRTWGSCTSEFKQTSQNVKARPQNRVTVLARGSGLLGSSGDVLTGGSVVQNEYCLKLWRHVRVAPHSVTYHSPPSAYPSTGVSAVAVAEPFRNIASTTARAVGLTLARAFTAIRNDPLMMQCGPAVALVAFSIWGLLPTLRFLRKLINKEDSKWATSRTQHVGVSYVQPIGMWIGIVVICRAFDPLVLSSEASQAIKGRFIHFVRSLATVLAFAFCTSRLTQQIQRAMMEGQDKQKSRNLGVQFVGSAVYTSVWVAAVCLFMELLGFSTQRWITAGGFGTVLLTLAGREIFTNFLSSIMIHATRPFIENEWIQTKIEGQEVSGTVEHVGWWSPTVIRGDDREAVHIPNHKFTVSVVRNLSQKSHWRIKTHFGISHFDIAKVSDIVADMRKVISKHPQVEQQRLHRRAFFDNVDPESQAILILVSCFVKTSHFEEYLRVKEIIFLDMLRVISHHNARLATPIRSVQRVIDESEARQNPFRAVATSAEKKKPAVNLIDTKAVSVKDAYDEGGDFQKADGVPKETVREVVSKDAGREGAAKSAPLKYAQFGEKTDPRTKKKSKDKATVMQAGSGEAGVAKPGPSSPAETSSPASSPKLPLEGLDSMGLNPNDITLLRAAYEKPPVDIPEGSVDLGPNVQIAQFENAEGKASVEHQNSSTIESAPPSNGAGIESVEPVNVPGESEKQSVTEQPHDDPWRKQSQVVTQPLSTGGEIAPHKVEAGQKGARISEEKVQAFQGQGAQGQVPRLQTVEENLVLGVALDGPNRTLPLDDDDVPSPAKQRELVASRNAGSATPPKDRRDPPSNPHPNSSAQFDSSRDRER